MEEQDKLAAAIDYFHGQSDLSPFAASLTRTATTSNILSVH